MGKKTKFKAFNIENLEIIDKKRQGQESSKTQTSAKSGASGSKAKSSESQSTKKNSVGTSSKTTQETTSIEVKLTAHISDVKSQIKPPQKKSSLKNVQAHKFVDKPSADQQATGQNNDKNVQAPTFVEKPSADQKVTVQNTDKPDIVSTEAITEVSTKVLEPILSSSAQNNIGHLEKHYVTSVANELNISSSLEDTQITAELPNSASANMDSTPKNVQPSRLQPDNPAWISACSPPSTSHPFSSLNPDAAEFRPGGNFDIVAEVQSGMPPIVENMNVNPPPHTVKKLSEEIRNLAIHHMPQGVILPAPNTPFSAQNVQGPVPIGPYSLQGEFLIIPPPGNVSGDGSTASNKGIVPDHNSTVGWHVEPKRTSHYSAHQKTEETIVGSSQGIVAEAQSDWPRIVENTNVNPPPHILPKLSEEIRNPAIHHMPGVIFPAPNTPFSTQDVQGPVPIGPYSLQGESLIVPPPGNVSGDLSYKGIVPDHNNSTDTSHVEQKSTIHYPAHQKTEETVVGNSQGTDYNISESLSHEITKAQQIIPDSRKSTVNKHGDEKWNTPPQSNTDNVPVEPTSETDHEKGNWSGENDYYSSNDKKTGGYNRDYNKNNSWDQGKRDGKGGGRRRYEDKQHGPNEGYRYSATERRNDYKNDEDWDKNSSGNLRNSDNLQEKTQRTLDRVERNGNISRCKDDHSRNSSEFYNKNDASRRPNDRRERYNRGHDRDGSGGRTRPFQKGTFDDNIKQDFGDNAQDSSSHQGQTDQGNRFNEDSRRRNNRGYGRGGFRGQSRPQRDIYENKVSDDAKHDFDEHARDSFRHRGQTDRADRFNEDRTGSDQFWRNENSNKNFTKNRDDSHKRAYKNRNNSKNNYHSGNEEKFRKDYNTDFRGQGSERGKYKDLNRSNHNKDNVRQSPVEVEEIATNDTGIDGLNNYSKTDEVSSDVLEKKVSSEDVQETSNVSKKTDAAGTSDWNNSVEDTAEDTAEDGNWTDTLNTNNVSQNKDPGWSNDWDTPVKDSVEQSDWNAEQSIDRVNTSSEDTCDTTDASQKSGIEWNSEHDKSRDRSTRDGIPEDRETLAESKRNCPGVAQFVPVRSKDESVKLRRSYDVPKKKDPRMERGKERRSIDSALESIKQDATKEESDKEYDEWERTWYRTTNFQVVSEQEGNLFEQPKDFSLAHCVAEDLRMGSGIAVDFKQEFKNVPNLLDQRARQGGLATLVDTENNRFVYYLVTKRESTGKPTYLTLFKSLRKMRAHIKENEVKKLAIPRLACGLDRLEWSKVKSMIEHLFKDVDVEIRVCNFQQDEEVPKKWFTRKLVFDIHPITEIATGTLILYFTTTDDYVDENMKGLSRKFNFIPGFKSHKPKKLGDIIYTEDKEYGLCGCIVRRSTKDMISFGSLFKCIQEFNKKNKGFGKDAFQYVAFQWVNGKDYFDELVNQKIITLLINYLRNVDVYVCTGSFDSNGE